MVLSQKVDLEDGLLRRIADDPEAVEVDGDYGAALGFLRKFTRRAWEIGSRDIERIRARGIPDADIVDWILMGAVQTLAVNQADGGGIWFPEQGSEVVGHDRSYYTSQRAGLTASSIAGVSDTAQGDRIGAPSASAASLHGTAPQNGGHAEGYFEPNRTASDFLYAAEQTKRRYGFVPNLLVALSNGRSPSLLPSMVLNLEILESPQSDRLTRRQHAIVRARTAAASRSAYASETICAQLEAADDQPDLLLAATRPISELARDPEDELVFSFAEKAARNAYKITEKDAARFRDIGMGDETYLDILGTVGLQLGLDRMAWATGVAPEKGVLLEKSTV